MQRVDKTSTETNRKYKDSVFTVLFDSQESLLELYKILHPEDTEVTINDIEKITLGNVLLVRRFNDAAMDIRNKLLILTEQQSTLNPNMPVRLLMYVAEEYEKIIKKNGNVQKLYSKSIVTLPAPEFYVIYTGDEKCGEYLYLSNAFPEEYRNTEFLQLKAKVITESDKHNILGGYIAFVKKAEKLRHTEGYTLKEALSEAVQWCKKEDILVEFMQERSEELMSLMLEEWNLDDALRYSKEEGKKEGKKEGMVYAYYEMDMNTNEIAKKVQLTEAEVLRIIDNTKKEDGLV